MKKEKIRKIIEEGVNFQQLCRVFFKYEEAYRYYFPLKTGEKLFLGAEEDDFIIDGYSVRRFRDIKKVQKKEDKCLEINRLEGNPEKIVLPDVDVDDWKAVFLSLQKIGHNIIVEKKCLQEDEQLFCIGRIEKVDNKKVYMRYFDAMGFWDENLWEIHYSQITSVTFGSRYVEVFSKYLPPISDTE